MHLCDAFPRRSQRRGGLYAQGYKFCRTCDRFLRTDAVRCPCCNTKLRVSARRSKYRLQVIEVRRLPASKSMLKAAVPAANSTEAFAYI